MRDSPSFTASLVAVARSLGASLDEDARLADDPYGARFATAASALLGGLGGLGMAKRLPLLLPFVLYMQLRTRAIDDVLRAFVHDGGRQVLLLGAGFDCRAARFRKELGDAVVYEVDHPATQARKRQTLAGTPSAHVEYLAWDFEARSLTELAGALAAVGHDVKAPTLTIWEGVTMYLSEPAIDATVGAVRALSGPRSRFVITYFDKVLVQRPKPLHRLLAALVAGVGEPFTFGWAPEELPGWLMQRGFVLVSDRDAATLARELLPRRHARKLDAYARHRHIAVARTAPEATPGPRPG